MNITLKWENTPLVARIIIYLCSDYHIKKKKMETSSKKRIIILSAIGILLTSLICLFAFRNVILCHIVDKRTTRAEQTYGLQIHYQELRMKGCNEVALQGLSIVPNQRDTLLTLQSVNVKLSFGNC